MVPAVVPEAAAVGQTVSLEALAYLFFVLT